MFRRNLKTILRLSYISSKSYNHNYSWVTFNYHSRPLIYQNNKTIFRFYSADALPSHTKITLPALSPTMEKGTLAKWEKKEGDSISEGDLLAEIETDKATVGLEASEEGFIAKIIIPAGTKDIPLGKLLCIVVSDKGDIDKFKDYTGDDLSSVSTTPKDEPKITKKGPKETLQEKPQPITPTSTKDLSTSQIQTPSKAGATPYAKTLAAEKGISLNSVFGSGPSGTVTSKDILKNIPITTSTTKPSIPISTGQRESYIDIDLSTMRQTIARRLLFSKQSIPHYYLTMEINMTHIEKARKNFNERLKDSDIKLSVNDFIIKASAQACLHHKECNSSWMDTQIRQYNNVDVSVAVSTPAGLITPIIFNAESKGLQTIHLEMKELAARAREGKLKPQEFQGGTFTVSNLGMFGIDEFTAIINPPQACILSIGTTKKNIVEDNKVDRGFVTIPVMKVTLGCDHRLVDGAVGAQWLKYFKNIMEDPLNMLL